MRIDGMDAVNRAQDFPVSTKESQFGADIPVAGNGLASQSTASDGKPAAQALEQGKKDVAISDKAVQDAINRVNKAISGSNRQFEFSIHQKTKQIMVKVIDTDTKEVIREIPPEKLLDMVAQMWEMAGILVDERR